MTNVRVLAKEEMPKSRLQFLGLNPSFSESIDGDFCNCFNPLSVKEMSERLSNSVESRSITD
jgi:hypothetical protein